MAKQQWPAVLFRFVGSSQQLAKGLLPLQKPDIDLFIGVLSASDLSLLMKQHLKLAKHKQYGSLVGVFENLDPSTTSGVLSQLIALAGGIHAWYGWRVSEVT